VPNAALRSQRPSQNNARSVVPIPSTIYHVPGYPKKLIVFRVAASPYFWCRCFFDGKHYKRSTRTDVKRKAVEYARKFFLELMSGSVQPVIRASKTPTKFAAIARLMLKEEEMRAEHGEVSKRYYDCLEQRIGKLLDLCGSEDIRDMGYQQLESYKAELFKRGLSNSTVRLYFASINKVLTYAQRLNVIQHQPIKPIVKQIDNARGYFELREYKTLRISTRELLGKTFTITQQTDGAKKAGMALKRVEMTFELLCLLPFMLYTFIRPTDLKTLKHGHVHIRTGMNGEYLFLKAPETKKHQRPITSMPRAAVYYRKLRAAQERLGFGKDTDYIFQPELLNRDSAYRKIANQFAMLLEQTGLKLSMDGEVRSLYSMRHTAIMYRLMFGGDISLLTLARNARTSVAMIERFYAAQLDSSKVTAEIHTKRRRTG
jgi:hypothetical protein